MFVLLLNYYNIVFYTKFFWTVFRSPYGTAGETKTKKVVTDRSYYSNIYIYKYKFGWDIIIKQVGWL